MQMAITLSLSGSVLFSYVIKFCLHMIRLLKVNSKIVLNLGPEECKMMVKFFYSKHDIL